MKKILVLMLAAVMCFACLMGCEEEEKAEKKDWEALVSKTKQNLPEMTEVARAMLYEAGRYEDQMETLMAELVTACEEYEGEEACEKLNGVCKDNGEMMRALTEGCIAVLEEYGSDVPTSRFAADVAEVTAEMSNWQIEYRNADAEEDYEDLMDEAEDWVNLLSEALYEETLV